MLPFNYVCIQAAETLQEVSTFREIFRISILLRLAAISAIVLIPVFFWRSDNGVVEVATVQSTTANTPTLTLVIETVFGRAHFLAKCDRR